MRLIDADALKEYLDICECCDKCPNKKLNCNADCTLPDFLTDDWERIINEQPTVPPHPQRMRGRWVEVTDGIYIWKVCDQCGEKPLWNEWRTDRYESNYCPNCGADMRGGEQDDR